MTVSFQSFIASPPFQFLVGLEKKVFFIHGNLVGQHSKILAVLVGGPMSEAKEKCAFLEDVDEDTFARFTEYAYTGDYSVPNPDVILTSSDIGATNVAEAAEAADVVPDVVPEPTFAAEAKVDDWSAFAWGKRPTSKKKQKKIANGWMEEPQVYEPPVPPADGIYCNSCGMIEEPKKTRQSQMWSAFTDKAYVRQISPWEPTQNKQACEDYTQVLLCHARLYVFSDRYEVEPLQKLTRQKLRLTLSKFHLFEERIPDVVELVKYTYKHTMDHDRGVDKLRSLVIDYVACHIESVARNNDFQEMLQDSGALSKDLVLRLIPRLD